jgi:xanthine dehydrogenase molybdenum-binding subunit
VGYTLTEQLIVDKGEVMNPNFRDYKVPTAKDAVAVETAIIETVDRDGPYGAKGIGEPGCVPTAPAIANAVYDATGVRIRELPLTLERVLMAIREKGAPNPVTPQPEGR